MHNIARALKTMCLVLAPFAWGMAAMPTHAQAPTVQVRDEPLHHLRMETDKFRVYDVVVDKRDAMQFHEHKADNVAVFLSESQITNESHLVACACLTLFTAAMAASAQTACPVTSADAAMELHPSQAYDNLDQRTWVNPTMPAATGNLATATVSADQQLQQRVAAYTRESLDRGGWRNAWVTGSHYAAGEPLLAVAVGTGATRRVAAVTDKPRHLAAH